MDIINQIERENMRMDIPVFRPGDTVKVHMRIVEGEKQRIQVFQGSVIRMHRGTTGGTFTVRKVSEGVGVERIFPINSPFIDHVDVVTRGSVRRSRPHQAPRQLLIVFVFLTSGQLRVSGAGFFSDFLPAWSLPS